MDQEELKKRVRDTYPFPIAHAYKKVLGCFGENEQKLKCIVETTEVILQFLALISLSQVQHDLIQNSQPPALAAVKEKIKKALLGETTPEQWRQMTLEIVKCYYRLEDQLVIPELVPLCFLPQCSDKVIPSRVQTGSVNPLLELRRQFYRNSVPASSFKERLSEGLNQLNELTDSCRFLSHYQLTFVRQITVDSERGKSIRFNHDLLHISGCYSNFDSSRWQSDFNLLSGGIVLLNRKKGRYLDLNPFLVFADQIPVPGVSDVYLLTGITRNRVDYRSSQFNKTLSSEDENWSEGIGRRETLGEFLDKLRLTNRTEAEAEIDWQQRQEPGETLPLHSIPQYVQDLQQRSAADKQPPNPYKFLDYYNPEDKEIFFGRDREIEIMQQRFYSSRVMVLHGDSGSGKTSLIRAGLIPVLSPETYTVVYVRTLKSPANEIKQEFIEQLGRDDRHFNLDLLDFLGRETEFLSKTVVMVLDQFEEFFIRFPRSVRQEFEKELSACFQVPQLDIKIIISMRSDYFSFLAEFEHFYPEIFNRQFHLQPLTEQQGFEAIVKPLQLLGIEVDESMVQNRLLPSLVANGKIEPPLLQIVCDALYGNLKNRGGNAINRADLEAVGSVYGAISQYLDKCLRQFGPNQQAAKSVLKGMVTSRETKHAAFLDELRSRVQTTGLRISSEELETKYLKKLIHQRLVRIETIGGKARFELSHEVLVQQISDWINESERELKETLQLIDQSYETYQLKGFLLSHHHIKKISPLRSQIQLVGEKKAFWEKSFKRWRRRKLAVWSTIVCAVGFFYLFGFIMTAKFPVPSNIEVAKEYKDWGSVLQLYSEVLEGRDDWRVYSKKRILVLWESIFPSNSEEEQTSAEESARLVEKKDMASTRVAIMIKSPKEAARKGTIKVEEIELGNSELSGLPYEWETVKKEKIQEEIRAAMEHFIPVIGLFSWKNPLVEAKFSVDGKLIAAGSEDKSVIVWDSNSGIRLAHLTEHTDRIVDLDFSPNRRQLAAASADGTILIWNLKTFKRESRLRGSQSSITSIDYSPDGKILASGSADGSIQLWNTLKHQRTKLLKGHKKRINTLLFHPDNKHLVSASSDLSIRLWDIKTGRLTKTLWGHKSAVVALDFDVNGNLISSGLDNVALDLDADNGDLISSDLDNVCIWNLETEQKQVIARGSNAIRINLRDNSLVSVTLDNGIGFFYSLDHSFPKYFGGIGRCCWKGTQIGAIDFNPDGSLMISTWERTIHLWLIVRPFIPLKNSTMPAENLTGWEVQETKIKRTLSWTTARVEWHKSKHKSKDEREQAYVYPDKSREERIEAWLKAAQNGEIPWFEDGGRSRVDFYRNALQYEKEGFR